MRAVMLSQHASAVAFLCFCDEEDKELQEEERKTRQVYERPDFKQSTWYRKLRDDAEELNNEETMRSLGKASSFDAVLLCCAKSI